MSTPYPLPDGPIARITMGYKDATGGSKLRLWAVDAIEALRLVEDPLWLYDAEW